MKAEAHQPPGSPQDRASRVDQLCDEFERARRAGGQPDIDAYCRRLPEADQSLLFEELLSLELELLRDEQSDVSVVDYLKKYAHARPVVKRVFEDTVNAGLTLSLGLVDALHSESEESHLRPLLQLEQLAEDKRFRPGEYLIRQGELADALIVVRDGLVEVHVEDREGQTHVVGHVAGGQVLGEMALLTSEPRTASAVAVDQVRAAILPAEKFHELARRQPQISSLLTNLMASRLGADNRDALTDKQLDRYLVRQRLGRGGMSVVYQAWDTREELEVALKMMSHTLVYSAKALRRFHQEADLIERFDHPNIVKMFHRFAAFHTYFIAMEYCAGETLADYLEREPLVDEESFKRSFGQLAAALFYAHEQGVIHRDIKPGNVMRDPQGALKLMDFGLAEPCAGKHFENGDAVGTPRYMSPEQRAGLAVDERADYFSLGCVAYEMLTGLPLFPRAALKELVRDFSEWQPPDFSRLAVPLSKSTVKLLQPLLAVAPSERQADLAQLAAWSE